MNSLLSLSIFILFVSQVSQLFAFEMITFKAPRSGYEETQVTVSVTESGNIGVVGTLNSTLLSAPTINGPWSRLRATGRLAGGLPTASVKPTSPETFFSVDNVREIERTCELYVPKDYDGSSELPLVVALHGFITNPGEFGPGDNEVDVHDRLWPIRSAVDSGNFLLLAPIGDPHPMFTVRYWQATNQCCGHPELEPFVDHASSIVSAVEWVQENYKVDNRRVYLKGESNGGGMALRLACEYPEIFAAVMAYAPVGYSPPMVCQPDPTESLSILVVFGTSDPLLPYEGGQVGSSFMEPTSGAIKIFKAWGERLRCNPWDESFEFNVQDLRPIFGHPVDVAEVINADTGNRVQHFRVRFGKHWPTLTEAAKPSFATFSWEWLSQFSK